MPWLKKDTRLRNHPKLVAAAGALGIKPVHLQGHLDSLWLGALERYEDGDLSGIDDESIAILAEWNTKTAEDMKRYPWTRRYAWQLHMYMFGLEIPRAVWILVNKSTGRVKQINADLDMEAVEAALQRCESINFHVKAGTYPSRLEPTPENAAICEGCQFFHLCAPAIKHGELKLIIDKALIAEVDEMQSLEESAKRYDGLKKSLKERFEATGLMLGAIGNWLYSGAKRNWSDRWVRLEN